MYKLLDGKEIEKSDRIRALQVMHFVLHYWHYHVICVLYSLLSICHLFN